MKTGIVLEMCIGSVESAIASQQGGANRVELCDNLLEGGTTPSAGTISVTREMIDIDLNVIIRPRGGDFLYSDIEFEVMKRDIEQAKQLGANGVVPRLLNADGSIDKVRTRQLVEIARPMSVTFHRAFDMARDPYEALEDLIEVGIDRILTTGQEGTLLEGLDLVAELVKKAGDRIIIMPGGFTQRTIDKVVAHTGAKEYHALITSGYDSSMQFRNPRAFMGGELRPPEYTRFVTDADQLRACRKIVGD